MAKVEAKMDMALDDLIKESRKVSTKNTRGRGRGRGGRGAGRGRGGEYYRTPATFWVGVGQLSHDQRSPSPACVRELHLRLACMRE